MMETAAACPLEDIPTTTTVAPERKQCGKIGRFNTALSDIENYYTNPSVS